MRNIDHLVVHCSATRPKMDIGAAEIRRWHVDGNGWADIGYHYVIRRDGQLELGRPIETAGAHVAGHNATSIGICLVGGIDDALRPQNNFMRAQFERLNALLSELRAQFPMTRILGHRDYPGVAKDCPCFDVAHWCMTQGMDPARA